MKKRIVVASLLAAGLLFSGCTTHPGAAAVYHGETLVSEASVETLAQSLGSDVKLPRTSLVVYLAYVKLLEKDITAEKTNDPDTFEQDGIEQCKAAGMNYKKANGDIKKLCNLFAMANGTGNEDFLSAFQKADSEITDGAVHFSARYAAVASQGQSAYPAYVIQHNSLGSSTQGADNTGQGSGGQGGSSSAY